MQRFLLAGLLTISIAIAAPAALAEFTLDLYAGGAFTDDEGLPFNVDNGFTGGLRLSYWIDPIPWLGVSFNEGAYGNKRTREGWSRETS